MTPATDTIAAIATPPGRGAVGILRLSGPQSFEIAARLTGELPPPRTAALRKFRDAQGQIVDEGLVLAFATPASYTGEDVVELQGHGGPAVLDLLLRAALAQGARAARPGEFSERAFLNGRLDLTQAEAVADLIAAGTEQAARAASRSLQGDFGDRVRAHVETLTQLRIHIEGALDFSDQDVDWLADASLRERLEKLGDDLRQLLATAAQGRRLRDGMSVALAGQPNVGKSTLLNALAGTDAAIVTDIPGTTRDLLREHVDLDGLPLTLVDTAGLRESVDPVEREGIRRAWEALRGAELVLFVVDDRAGVTAADRALLAQAPDARTLIVRNKRDLRGAATATAGEIRISARTGEGIDALRAAIREAAGLGAADAGVFSARTRHVTALERARAAVQEARRRIGEGADAELAAEDLRRAQEALGEITGAVTPDDLLGRVFASFCIGK